MEEDLELLSRPTRAFSSKTKNCTSKLSFAAKLQQPYLVTNQRVCPTNAKQSISVGLSAL